MAFIYFLLSTFSSCVVKIKSLPLMLSKCGIHYGANHAKPRHISVLFMPIEQTCSVFRKSIHSSTSKNEENKVFLVPRLFLNPELYIYFCRHVGKLKRNWQKVEIPGN